eukprot:GILK01003243.1.p1 GENE.GILK01003243.1~~GILK01003243.1.p1  ORF type:complete len:570 (+),score=98.15 GILK01003243.1:52-1761(+)
MKYLAVAGGTVSGLGKGTAISSIGVLLKAAGLRTTSMKIDPYLNTDAGTMSPFEHGEVFVLEDGGEADLDLGNYERFLDITLSSDHNITTGKVYSQVIRRERKGDYLGKTVQVVPHVTDAVQEWIQKVAYISVDDKQGPPDVCLIEVGGTVGDIESMVYLEALRQFQYKLGPENFALAYVSLVPVLGTVGEQKTKPTQHGVKELRSYGLTPDFILCRASEPLEKATREKLSSFCQVPASHVISVHDVSNIYRVPLLLQEQGLCDLLCKRLQLVGPSLPPRIPNLARWEDMANKVDVLTEDVVIALVGKYTGLQDSYLSVVKALKHGAIHSDRNLVIEWIESTDLEPAMKQTEPEKYESAWRRLRNCDGVLCPGGFGDRGIEGKILAANYARTNNVPYLGVCLGLQIAVIEFARNVLGMKTANSAEFDEKTNEHVVVFMPEISTTAMGGTMRLGSRLTIIKNKSSLGCKLYGGKTSIYERHRHRYEVNPDKVAELEAAGLKFSGIDERAQRMEILELEDHPFYFATQFHPEFKSRPNRPSPPFLGFILAASKQLEQRIEEGGGVVQVEDW